jgi:beta-glucanase (GH16 family)
MPDNATSLSRERKNHPHLSRLRIMRAFRVFLLVIPLSFVLAACQSSTGPSSAGSSISNPLPAGQTGNWNMLFHDEFDGNSLDTSKWTTCYFNFKVGDGCDHDQNELELYQPDNISVNNGVLTLQAEKKTVNATNGQTYNYTSGMITTGPTSDSSDDTRFSFKYGYMEMRAKVPAGQGLWPAFWTLPTTLNWPPEIDVFEILGNAPNVLNMHYHYPNGTDDGGDDGVKWTGPDFSAGWHTYAVDWEPNAITWYVDGVQRRTYTDASKITANPMYLIANLAVGGDWPGSPDASTQFPAQFQIDYIRVWQKQ